MDEPKAFPPELSPSGSRKWIGRLVIAVVLGAAIWNFVVSLTVNAVIPGLARVMESDPQSPLYLGKGDVNVAALFISLLELCFAAIAAAVVNSVSTRRPRVARKKTISIPSAAVPATVLATAPAIPATAPTASPVPAPRVEPPRESIPTPPPAPKVPTVPTPAPPAAKPQAVPAPAPPAKPTKPKKVYYNIVGERIEEDDE